MKSFFKYFSPEIGICISTLPIHLLNKKNTLCTVVPVELCSRLNCNYMCY